MRSPRSKTFERADGTFVTEFFTDVVHYQPEQVGAWQPIDLTLRQSPDRSAVEMTGAPARLTLRAADTPDGFLALQGGGHLIRFGLPPGAASGRPGTSAEIKEDGLFVEYSDFLPGGIGLRVFPNADGFKSFLVLPERPATNSFSLAISAPNLDIVGDESGGFEFRDRKGNVVGRIPRPYMEDSSEFEGRGGGLYSEAVAQTISEAPNGYLLTLSIDEEFLDAAVYPVYVDPTTTDFPTATTTAGDSFVNSQTPNTNYDTYQRTSSPYYREMWHGNTPGTSYYNEVFIRFYDVAATLAPATIDSAILDFFPYWQYFHYTCRSSWIERVAANWSAGTITWNNKPGIAESYGTQCTNEGQWSHFDVKDYVQGVANGTFIDYGLKLHANPQGQGGWKRIVSRNDSSNLKPKLIVAWHTASATPVSPINGAPGGRSLSWAYDPGDAETGHPQSHYWVQVATSNTFGTIVAETPLIAGSRFETGATHGWTIPSAVSLTEGPTYWWRVKVRDGFGESNWSAAASFKFAPGSTMRGEQSYYTRVPFDLGGGWRMSVGAHNGELALARNLFEIPSYGPAQSLSLSYSSLNTTAGFFGTGWSSNLTQHLTFGSGVIYWQRADGGVVPFTLVGSTWTPAAGNFETLVHDSANSRYIVTQNDQTKHFFQQAAPGRLIRTENRFGKALALIWGTTSATATDASGRVTKMIFASGRITSSTDSAGRTWSFAYTSNNLTSITDPAGKATTLAYGASGLTSLTRTRSRVSGSPETITWSIAYASGKVSSVTDPINASAANTFGYTATTTTVGLLKTYSPVVLNNWTYTIDSLGRVTAALDPAGYTTRYTYDGNSNLTRLLLQISNSPAANQTIDFSYDARGNVMTQVEQLTDTTSVTTLMTYNLTNDLLIRSESDNHSVTKLITRHTYDGAGRLASVNVNCTSSGTTPPASAGGCTGAGTQNSSTNLITTYTYTANDQLENETDPLGRVTRHVYDSHGNRIETIANFVFGQSATHERNVSTSYAYNQATAAGKAGLVTAQADPVGNPVTYAYDVMGRQTSESLSGDASIPALTRTTTYDELGNVLTSTDAWSGVSRTTSYVYDRANREISVTDPAGVEATTAYNAAGDAISSSSAGVTTSRTFDGLGRTLSETSAGATTSYTYDGQGREIEVVDPEGVRTVRAYDRAGRLTSETVNPTPGANLVTSYTYDVLGRENTVTSPDGLTTTTSYDRPGRVVQSVSAGVTTTYIYDRAGNQLSTTVGGVLTTTEYDPLNRPTVVIENDVATPTLPIHDVTTTTYYDAAGNTLAVRDPLGITTRSILNVRGLVAQSIANCTDSGTTPTANPRACVGAGTHNATTNVVSTTSYDGLGGALLTIVAQGTGAEATVHSSYDAAGRQQAVKDARGTVTRFEYDADGRLTKTITNCTNDTSSPAPPTGSWWNCAGSALNDGTWNVTTTRTYDARGNVASETAPNGRKTTYVNDAADRLIERIDNDVPGTPSSPDQDLSTFYAYDDAGRQSAVRSPTTNRMTFSVTRFFYDAEGRLQKEVRNCTSSGTTPPGDPAWKTCTGAGTKNASTNLETVYGYDSRGNRTSVTAADPSATSGTGTGTVTTRYAYDDENRLCRVLQNATVDLAMLANPCSTGVSGTASQNVSTRYTYDALGNLASMIDGRGNHTHYVYDAGGRMVRISEPIANSDPNATAVLNVSTTYNYDSLGNRISQSQRGSANTILISWTYDGAGRTLSRVAGSQTTSWTYDDNGNRLTATNGAGTVSATYDRLNRPLQVTVSGDTGATTTYSYSLASPSWTDPSGAYAATLDKFDRQVSLTDPIHGSSPFLWTYRADGRIAAVAAPNGNATAYGYDAAGALNSKNTTGTGGVPRAAYSFTHNRAGQTLTEASTIDNDPSNGTTTYAYDKLGRVASFARGTTTSYGWQEVPNRSSVQVGANPAVTTSYSDANRPASDSAGGSYGHDIEGRMMARPGQTLEWDALGRLTAVRNSSNNALISSYTYDALDRLLTAERNGVDHLRFRYVGLTAQPAQVVNHAGDTVIRSIANDWTGTHLVDWTGSGANQRFYGTNAHHDVTWTASDTGTVSNTLRYDPWGTLTASSGTSLPDFRYQGSWLDSQTDLVWIVTRWYAPALGRFISEDSLLGQPEEPSSRNLYAYAAGNPVAGCDPDGRITTPVQVLLMKGRRQYSTYEGSWLVLPTAAERRQCETPHTGVSPYTVRIKIYWFRFDRSHMYVAWVQTHIKVTRSDARASRGTQWIEGDPFRSHQASNDHYCTANDCFATGKRPFVTKWHLWQNFRYDRTTMLMRTYSFMGIAAAPDSTEGGRPGGGAFCRRDHILHIDFDGTR